MFKQSRSFFSAMMIATLLLSTLILSTRVSAKSKCPVEPPKTLLSLYLQSDLVIIADIRNEKITKIEGEENESDYVDVERNLDIIKTFKGQKLPEISFVKSEYRPAVKTNAVENSVGEVYADDEYYNVSDELKAGKRYLFFFAKADENAAFYPTDYRSAGREMTPENTSVYEKRLAELGKILANKKNQLPKIAEWLVRLTEDEPTRWDGVSALARSFSSLRYEQAEEEAAEEEKLTIDEDFSEYSSAIAKQISSAQKERISSVLTELMNRSFLGNEKPNNNIYEFTELVGNWDKTRFAMYGFGILQSIDRADIEKSKTVMNFIANISGDSELSEIYYEYSEFNNDEAESENEITEIPVQSETTVENTEKTAETSEQNSANNGASTELIIDAKNESGGEKLTQAQLREQIFQKFVNRYQALLARNFAPEAETETAENIVK